MSRILTIASGQHPVSGAISKNLSAVIRLSRQAKAKSADNYLWVSGSNTSKKESCFPAFVLQPDGRLLKKLNRNRTGILISSIDLDQRFKTPSAHWRSRASRGILHGL